MGHPGTDPLVAAQAMTMGDAGYSSNQIAPIIGLPGRTIRDIIARHGKWGELAEKPVFASLRQAQTQHLEAAGRALAAKAMIQCEDMLPKANAYQACLISSIMIDKSRLLAGEATQIVEVNTKLEATGLDQFCKLLSQALIVEEATDITPVSDNLGASLGASK